MRNYSSYFKGNNSYIVFCNSVISAHIERKGMKEYLYSLVYIKCVHIKGDNCNKNALFFNILTIFYVLLKGNNSLKIQLIWFLI